MRVQQILLLIVLLAWSWSVMTICHELGHVAGAVIQGARVSRLELFPWQFPSSLFTGEASRTLTLWCGPVLGCIGPVVAATIFHNQVTRFVAGFCLVANGTYLFLGYFSGDAFLDSTLMIQHGTPAWMLVLVAGLMTVAGYLVVRRSCIERFDSSDASRSKIAIALAAWVLFLTAQACLASLTNV